MQEENRKFYNMIQDLKGSIRVFCRIRPLGRTGDSSEACINVAGTFLTHLVCLSDHYAMSDFSEVCINVAGTFFSHFLICCLIIYLQSTARECVSNQMVSAVLTLCILRVSHPTLLTLHQISSSASTQITHHLYRRQ